MVLVAPCVKQGLTGLFNVWAPNAVTVYTAMQTEPSGSGIYAAV